jgi:hypothetical protein
MGNSTVWVGIKLPFENKAEHQLVLSKEWIGYH